MDIYFTVKIFQRHDKDIEIIPPDTNTVFDSRPSEQNSKLKLKSKIISYLGQGV